MGRTVEEIMTRDPRTVDTPDDPSSTPRIMRDSDIGDAVLVDGG